VINSWLSNKNGFVQTVCFSKNHARTQTESNPFSECYVVTNDKIKHA